MPSSASNPALGSGTELSLRQRRAFRLARRVAAHLLKRRFRVLALVRDAYRKLRKNPESLRRGRADLQTLLRLSKAWGRREYRSIPWRSMLYVTAALVYFVNPLDAIPDALFGIGFADDLVVIGAVVRAVRKDLDAFLTWEQRRDTHEES